MRQTTLIPNKLQPPSVQAALRDHRLSSALIELEPKSHNYAIQLEFEKLAKKYYLQLTQGCMKTCDFSICASNPRARRVEAEAAAIMALQLANSKKSYLCPRIPDELEIDAMPPFPFGPLLAPKSRSNQSSRNHSRSSSMISFNEKPNSFFTSLFANMVEGKSKFSHSRSASDVGKLGLNKLAVSDSHNALEEVHNRPSSPTDSDLSSMDSLNSLCKASLIDYDNSQFGLSKLNLSLVQIAIETCTLVDMNGQPDFNFLLSTIRSVFSSVSTLSRSFTIGDEIFNTIDLNVKDISSAYEMILELKNEDLIEEICDSSEIALKKICSRIKVQPNGSPSLFRAMIIIMMNQSLKLPLYHDPVLKLLMGIFDRIGSDGCRIFTQWIKELETEVFESLLGTVHAFLAEASFTNERYPRSLTGAVKFLSLFSLANEARAVPLDISLFYAHKLIRKLNFKDEYLRWKKASKDKGQSFAFFNYPFLLDPIAKTRILHIDAMLKMSLEYEQACVGQAMIQSAQRFIDNATLMEDYEKKMNDMNNPFLVLEIRREHLVQDTITHLSNKREYRKPLKVKFIAGGEEGLDQGGVQKEFFQLFTSQLLDPALGMFSYDEDTRLSWFRHGFLESLKCFECLGTIVGLALYNGVMLGIAFPIIMYKKLLNEEITFADFKQSFPQLGSGLEQLLNWSGNDVQQIFMRNFQIDIESFGVIECYDLVENGGTIWVTDINREEFVRLYIDFYINKSIEKQFKSFQGGFFKVCSSQALSLCRPQELELLLCGKMTSDIDFLELEKGTTYDDGYSPNHQVIRWFWEIVHEMDTNHKKFLLEFVTASDRIPLRGLGSLMFVIQRNGPDSNRLPTSLTCFGRFLLPEYSSSEKLKRMVYLAIENAKGFGLV